ncbi:MAG: hypothetical protein GTO41_21610 [Burkholderiales bacterium]|nr:hypothetical protein [Burkholderiales bacterium]
MIFELADKWRYRGDRHGEVIAFKVESEHTAHGSRGDSDRLRPSVAQVLD